MVILQRYSNTKTRKKYISYCKYTIIGHFFKERHDNYHTIHCHAQTEASNIHAFLRPTARGGDFRARIGGGALRPAECRGDGVRDQLSDKQPYGLPHVRRQRGHARFARAAAEAHQGRTCRRGAARGEHERYGVARRPAHIQHTPGKPPHARHGRLYRPRVRHRHFAHHPRRGPRAVGRVPRHDCL